MRTQSGNWSTLNCIQLLLSQTVEGEREEELLGLCLRLIKGFLLFRLSNLGLKSSQKGAGLENGDQLHIGVLPEQINNQPLQYVYHLIAQPSQIISHGPFQDLASIWREISKVRYNLILQYILLDYYR